MGLLDRFRKKSTEKTPSKPQDGPATNEYTPGGSPVYRYEDHQEEGFRPPETVGIYAKEVEEHFSQMFPNRGHYVIHEILSDLIHVDIHVLRPNGEDSYYVLYTTGMSDLPMHLPEELSDREDLKYGELYMFLPADWNVGEDLANPQDLPYECYWPIQMLKFLARFPHEYKTWLGFGHTMPNGPDYAPVCNGVGFGGMVLDWHGSEFGRVETKDGHDVLLYFVIPAYKEEIEYKLKYGMEGLHKRFSEEKLPLVLDVHRPNYCADFHEVLD